LGPGLILHGDGQHFCLLLAELSQVCFQLSQLVPANTSSMTPIEDQDNSAFVSIVLEGN
jgi:hypothetical protein